MSKEAEKVRRLKKEMVEIFGKCCWMDYIITKQNPMTAHHIVEKRNDGLTNLDNLAIVTNQAHKALNFLDNEYHRVYTELNGLFLELNRTKMPPAKEYFEEVDNILKRVRKMPYTSHKKQQFHY